MKTYELAVDEVCPDELKAGRKYIWFCKMWDILRERGLTSYSTQVGRVVVKARAVVLHVLLAETEFKIYGDAATKSRPLETDLLDDEEAEALYHHFCSDLLPDDFDKKAMLIPVIEASRTLVVEALTRTYSPPKLAAVTYYVFDNPEDVTERVDGTDVDEKGRPLMTVKEFNRRYWSYMNENWSIKLGEALRRNVEGARKAFQWVYDGCPCVREGYEF